MRPRLLQVGRLLPRLEEGLARAYHVHGLWEEADREGFLRRRGGEFTGLVTSAQHGASGALLEALPALRVLAVFGVGLDAIDLETAKRRGVAVSSTPDVLTDCVADLAMGLLLDVARAISAADRFVRRGAWPGGRLPLATRLGGKRLGIVGLGRIGRAVARRAAAFDLEVRYHGRRPVADAPHVFEPSLLALAGWADALVLACTGGPETRHLVGAEVLEALGPQGLLVNVARGSVVDEAALVRALAGGRLGGAGLDVFEAEPEVPAALLAMENVVLQPHRGSATRETRDAMADLVLENLRAFYAEGRLVTPVG